MFVISPRQRSYRVPANARLIAGEVVFARGGVPGQIQETPENAYAVGCGWADSLVIDVEKPWPSGVYLISLRACGHDGSQIVREADDVP